MDALLFSLYEVCLQLVPILASVVLIMLCLLLKKGMSLIDELTNTIKNTTNTIKLVDQSLEKFQTPLDTVVKVSHTVDNVHDSTVENVKKAKEYINENIENVKTFVNEKINKGDASHE